MVKLKVRCIARLQILKHISLVKAVRHTLKAINELSIKPSLLITLGKFTDLMALAYHALYLLMMPCTNCLYVSLVS